METSVTADKQLDDGGGGLVDYQLWLGDCLEEMNRIEDGSMDAIIADLPYGTTACAFDKRIPFEPLWKQYERVIKRNGAIVLFGSQPFTSLLILSNFEWFKYCWYWYKNLPSGFAQADYQPMRAMEEISIFYENQPTYNKQLAKTVISDRKVIEGSKNGSGSNGSNHFPTMKQVPNIMRENVNPRNVLEFDGVPNASGKLHPTQKPIALLEYLIKTYTNEGETVLDNTMGSGSTGEACLRTNRKFIGIEKHKPYFDIAKSRLEKVAAELRGELNHLPLFQEAAV